MKQLSSIIQEVQRLVSENSNAILTSLGVTGTIGTAVLTGKASFKAAEKIRIADLNLRHESDGHDILTMKDKTKIVWKDYIPAAGAGVTTVACIVVAHRLSSREIAALAAASAVTERTLSEYRTKVVEKFGEGKARAVRDEIAQDRLKANPVTNTEVIITGNGDVLCRDAMSGRYFTSSSEKIQKAANAINTDLLRYHHASLSQFYEQLDLPATGMSDNVGWNSDHLLELSISTGMSSDDRPCLTVDFAELPFTDYARKY